MTREKISTIIGKSIFYIAVAMALFQLYNSIFPGIDPVALQNMHLMFSFVIIFLGVIKKELLNDKSKYRVLYSIAILILALGATLYVQFNHTEMVLRVGQATKMDLIIGVILLIVTIDATRVTFGKAIPIIIIIGIAYMITGPYFSGILYHGGFSYKRIISTLVTNFSGLYGSLLRTSATYIALFMIFGGLLTTTGAGQFFVDMAMVIGGRYRAGAGLAAIIASGLMGMINGSAVAVVATTGVLTIPLMIKRGYNPSFAAALSAVASTGGMILPPVMGVGAFIMAELTGNTYAMVAYSALVPALLYYTLCASVVVVRVNKIGLQPLPAKDIPDAKSTMREGILYIVPILGLIYALARGYSTSRAALIAIALLIVIKILKIIVTEPRKILDVNSYKSIVEGLAEGGKGCTGIAVTMACVGVLGNTLISTGLANRLINMILQLGNEGALFSLIITALLTIVLGCGVPTTAAYIVMAMMAAPTLVKIGLPALGVHLFIFYFAAIANLTPPVAPATIVASRISNSNYVEACGYAMKMCISAFVLPFIFVFRKEMLLQGNIFDIIHVVGSAFIGLVALSFFMERYIFTKNTILQQIALIICSVMLILPMQIGYTILAIVLISMVIFQQRKTIRALA